MGDECGMYCANCGKKLEEDARFCEYCGTAVSMTDETVLPRTADVYNGKIQTGQSVSDVSGTKKFLPKGDMQRLPL